jgi:AcrR family transcriptional regulator
MVTEMVMTPWGESGDLRRRRLPPGGGIPREKAERNQRQRLYGAMVASCAERGYEATTVANLLELSGVSRGTFYDLFDDKLGCFQATVAEVLSGGTALILAQLQGEGSQAQRAQTALRALSETIAAQPAAARMCLVESYAAGEPAVERVRAAVDEISALGRGALDQVPGHGGMAPELADAIVGGFDRIVYSRLESRREAELPALAPALWEWAVSYRPPPEALRLRGRRGAVALEGTMPPFAAFDPEQRLIRAFAQVVAEKGYGETTIADIAAAASISQSTFYAHFADKADAMEAALDSSGAQLLAAAMPAASRAPDWPRAVRVALGAICGFLAAEPAFARIRLVAVYAAGPRAIVQRDRAGIQLLRDVLSRTENSPDVEEITLEAIVGAIYRALHDQIRSGGTETLPEAAPLATYLALAPLLGAEQACEIANSDGRVPRRA